MGRRRPRQKARPIMQDDARGDDEIEGLDTECDSTGDEAVDGTGAGDSDGETPLHPKYHILCPGCGALRDSRRMLPRERHLLSRSLCSSCAGDDPSYELERDTYVRFQSRHAHDPNTPLHAHADYSKPRHPRLIAEIAASDALRRSMKLPGCGFLCHRHGQYQGLMLVHFRSSALLPTVPDDCIWIEYLGGVNRDTVSHVVVALCAGVAEGVPVYCFDRDITQAELAALLNVWPQHVSTQLRHSAEPGWKLLREGRYRVRVGSTYQYFFPSHLVARVLLGAEMCDRLRIIVPALEQQSQ